MNIISSFVKISKIKIFADHATLHKTIETVEECDNLQTDLVFIYHWYNLWLIKLNPSKY